MTKRPGSIYVGIGGWTYEPWRGVFYPKGLPHARELAYAGEHLTSIEVNGTFYRTQTPATFRKWASEVPERFVFSLKGPRYAVNRRVLKEAGDSIKRFLNSGVTELGDPPRPPALAVRAVQEIRRSTISAAFSNCCRKTFDGHTLRHVVEVRHDSFKTPAFVALLRQFNVPRRLRRTRYLPDHRRRHRRFRLCATAEGRRKTQGRLSAEGTRCLGRARQDLGARRRAEGSAARRPRRPRRNSRATSSSISSTRRRCARRPQPWR